MNDNELDYPMFGLLSVESRNVVDRSPFELQIIRQCAFRIPYLKRKSVFRNPRRLSSLSAQISGKNTLNNLRQMRICQNCSEKELIMLFGFTILI